MRTQPVARGEAIELNLDDMTVEQGLELIEVERVQPLLKYLKTGVFENKTNMTFMKAYSVVVQFGDRQPQSVKLYSYYKRVIGDYCAENAGLMVGLTGDELLRKLADFWEKHTILTFWMQRVFQYLDRFFTRNSQDDPDLFTTALREFHDKLYTKVKEPCVRALIETINRERNGLEIDQRVVRLLVEMLCTTGDTQPRIAKQKEVGGDRLYWISSMRDCYKADFENHFLSDTADFYRAKVAGWLAEYSCLEMLREIARRLDEEDSRLKRYLDGSSEEALRKVCQNELILCTAKRLVEMDSGCEAMFVQKNHDGLSLMYRLFRREPTMLSLMTDVMEPYIERRCTAIVGDQQNIENPSTYIEQVLDLKAELEHMMGHCFENDSAFQKARNNALEKILNKETRCASYLANFCDMQLKKGLKGRSEEDMGSLVNQVIGLFAHLKDKDIFLDCYKKHLSRRLLNRLSVSNDAEDMFITKLKVEVGQQAISKLVAMFTDMTISDQLQERYNRLTHGGSPEGVAHEVRVLQTNAWPEKADAANVVPCEEMNMCIRAFEQYYNAEHSGRKLKWMFNMGQVEVGTHCFQRKHTLVVHTYQAIVLMLFNKKPQVTFGDIVEATKLPRDECHRQVLSMAVAKHRILSSDGEGKKLEDSTVLSVNKDFAHERVKVLVSLIKEKEKAPEPAVAEAPVERRHVLDAAIVRIMKARKKLDHNSLLDEVFRQCILFKPQPSQIKAQVENLIDREFLKRDVDKRSVYIYVP